MAASRAFGRAVLRRQSTLVLGLSDFDQAGIRNILRPHVVHLSAFLYGTAGNKKIVGAETESGELLSMENMPDLRVEFSQLALTPETTLGLVEGARDRERIEEYAASGETLWSRGLDLLADVQKIEMEALDPVELRDFVVGAIESVIVATAMNGVLAEEKVARQAIAERFGKLADQLDGEAA